MNFFSEKPYSVKRYRFCGLPMGVSMLPRFAATVIRIRVYTVRRRSPKARRRIRAKGTRVTSATSFVSTMLRKKDRRTRNREI